MAETYRLETIADLMQMDSSSETALTIITVHKYYTPLPCLVPLLNGHEI